MSFDKWSFAKLKANSASTIQKLVEAASKNSDKGSSNDQDFWSPTVDKAGNGFAVIRFLPAPQGEDLPWVKYWDHGFKGPTGRWYIENSLTSIGQPDPLSELNSALWNSGIESNKEIVRKRKRRLHYVANIYIVSDPANPANEGKVFLYKFGKKIFDKIIEVMTPPPQFQEEPINVFDFWTGANFKLKIRNVEDYRNYDKCEFDKPSPLLGGNDSELERIYSELKPLKTFVDPKNYKTYEQLKKKLVEVLGAEAVFPDKIEDIQKTSPAPEPKSAVAKSPPVADSSNTDGDPGPFATNSDDEEDPASYFSGLLKS